MSQVIASNVLANGLRDEFADTYMVVRDRLSDSRLSRVMDLGLNADNRYHDFGYFEAAPYMEYWRRGESIPQDVFDSTQFQVQVFNYARRVAWHKDDRKDERTQSLFDMARKTGEAAALLPEQFFFDLIQNTTNTLPAVPNAPDGAAMYATTDGASANRFGVSSGNLLTGTGVTTLSTIQTDYYSAYEQFKLMQDGKGQPLHSDESLDSGMIIIHGAANTEVFEKAFLQLRQGVVLGTDAGTTPSNVVLDASRNVMLWGTQRISNDDWYVFMANPPKMSTFMLTREAPQEFTSLEGDNNSDLTRSTGEEYIQWEARYGAGIALPYATIKIDN